MNKEEKVKVVEELKGQLNDYKSIYLTDIAGLDAMQTSKLRRECFNSNVKLSVVKNTFLERAMSESENDFGELKELLSGNTTIMLSESGNSPAKVIKKFRKDSEKPILKDAFVDVTCALFALKLLRNLFPTAANEIVAMLRTCFALECAVLLSSTMIHPS